MTKDTDEIRDTYAQFGLTFSRACMVENYFVNLIVTSDFIKRTRQESAKLGKPIYETRDEMSRAYDLYVDEHRGKTMGALIGGPKRKKSGLKDFIDLAPELDARVEDALRRRNYLTHAFWRERGGEAISVKRRELVRNDLVADQKFFEDLQRDLERVMIKELNEQGLDGDKAKLRVDNGVIGVQRELAR